MDEIENIDHSDGVDKAEQWPKSDMLTPDGKWRCDGGASCTSPRATDTRTSASVITKLCLLSVSPNCLLPCIFGRWNQSGPLRFEVHDRGTVSAVDCCHH